MSKKELIPSLISKILEFAFIIVSIINLNAISHHLCCDMDNAVITMAVVFSLLSVCVLFQIMLE